MRKTTFRLLAVLGLAVCFTSGASAQGGTVPGSGLVPLQGTTGTPVPTDLTTPMPAECLGQTEGPWTVVAPFGWIFGIRGNVGAGFRTVPVDVSVGDAIDKLGDLKGAAQIHLETGYGKYGLIADLTYLRMVSDGRLVTVESRATFLELMGMYRVIDTGTRGAGAVTLDMLAGGRFYRFSNDIQGNVFGLLSVERNSSWVDLVVGARAGVQVTDNLGLFARGDMGGYSIGDSSDRAYNVVLGYEYHCSECVSLLGGYRWLKIDREAGSGRDRFLLDATFSGPFVAFALRF